VLFSSLYRQSYAPKTGSREEANRLCFFNDDDDAFLFVLVAFAEEEDILFDSIYSIYSHTTSDIDYSSSSPRFNSITREYLRAAVMCGSDGGVLVTRAVVSRRAGWFLRVRERERELFFIRCARFWGGSAERGVEIFSCETLYKMCVHYYTLSLSLSLSSLF